MRENLNDSSRLDAYNNMRNKSAVAQKEVEAMADNIKKQKDGRYHAQVYLGKDVTGKRIVRSVAAKTKYEVQLRLNEIREEYLTSVDVAGGEATFAKWTERWLTRKETTVGVKLYEQYKSIVEKTLPMFGSQKMNKIQTYQIQAYIDDLAAFNPFTGKPTGKKTLKAYKSVFSQVFDYAVMNRAVSFNPAAYVTIPRNAPKQERRALTEQERQWIEQTPHRVQPMAMIMLYAGLRRGEAIALRWSDINFEKGTISVSKSVTFIKGKPELKPPKTKAGVRTVYISDKLCDFLKEYRSRAADGELVCPSLNGEMFTEDSFRRAWQSFQRELNITSGLNPYRKSKYDPRFSTLEIDNITPHMLRHTFCSMMYENGVSVKTAQNQMGHASASVTLEIYTHLDDNFAREDMRKMNVG